MNDFLKYTSPSWNEVLTEQESNIKLSCSENSRRENLLKYLRKKYSNNHYIKLYEWEEEKALYKKEIAIDFGLNSKIYKELIRKEKYGHPKRCPAINHITNLIIF